MLLVAFAWLLLAGLPPQQQRAQEQRQTDQAIANSLANVTSAIERGNERQEYNPECEPGRDNRRSDLCAQWKAADAASESAAWARWFWWLTLVGTAIGAATLGAAVAAAIFAKQAAGHADRGANEAAAGVVQAKRSAEISKAALKVTRETTKHQLQAYVGIAEAALSSRTPTEADDTTTHAALLIKNFGQTQPQLFASGLEFAS